MAEETISYTYQEEASGVVGVILRAPDNAFIPLDLANMDYQAFLAWMAEGNAAPQGWTGPTNTSG